MANLYGPGQRGKYSDRAKKKALNRSNMMPAHKQRRGMTLDPGQRASRSRRYQTAYSKHMAKLMLAYQEGKARR